MSTINHDGDSSYCGHYVSDVFDANMGIWWHCDAENITQISDLPKRVYSRESHKKNRVISGSTDLLFVFYIRTSHLKKYSFFIKFANISKINNMKKLIEDLNVFREYFKVRQEVSDDIKQLSLLLSMRSKILLKIIYFVIKERKIIFV